MAKNPNADTRPTQPTHIDLKELKDILGRAVKNETERKELLADPEAALKKMNYMPDAGAVAFLKSLRGSHFDKSGAIFQHHDSDPAYGMAEN